VIREIKENARIPADLHGKQGWLMIAGWVMQM
jgi:hypothetical protein